MRTAISAYSDFQKVRITINAYSDFRSETVIGYCFSYETLLFQYFPLLINGLGLCDTVIY